MKRLVFYTGAGMSRESGLPTFRGDGGLWSRLDVDAVADRKSWYSGRMADCNVKRQAMLDFFNPMRRMILAHGPNAGHRMIAALESSFDVTVVTQNGDDYHERAGSGNVIHLHGEALKNSSTLHPYVPFDIDLYNPDIHIGDKAADGSQVRPFVIFFNEEIDRKLWRRAVEAVSKADVMVVIGSTMLVYPAASLFKMLRVNVPLYVIDPGDVGLPGGCERDFIHFRQGAVDGMYNMMNVLSEYQE